MLQVTALAQCRQAAIFHVMIPLIVIEMRDGQDDDDRPAVMLLPGSIADLAGLLKGIPHPSHPEVLLPPPPYDGIVRKAAVLTAVLRPGQDALPALFPVGWVVAVVDWHRSIVFSLKNGGGPVPPRLTDYNTG